MLLNIVRITYWFRYQTHYLAFRRFDSSPCYMSTINQIIKKPRKKPTKKSRVPGFKKQPFAKGICLKVFIAKPKKPNSALRKVARIRLSTKKTVNAHIGGEGHTLQQFGTVLVRGGRCRDLPGVKYRCVRGKYDLYGVANRRNSRSKYGTLRPKDLYET